MKDQYLDQRKFSKHFSVYFFLLGCAALPFFNDFPLFAKIVPSFRDLPTVFFILSGLMLLLESALDTSCINKNRTDFYFVMGFVVFIWGSVIWNYNSSSQICGEKMCGAQRLVSSAISLTAKMILLLFFIKIVKNIGIYNISKFVRFGFYLSFSYVLAELVLLVIPYYLDYESFALFGLIENYFHIRENDYGGGRTRGLSFEPSYQAVYLIICLPFLLADKKIRRRKINIFAWTVCLLSSLATTGLVAAIFFIIFFNYQGRKLFFIIISAVIFIIIFCYWVVSFDLLQLFDIYGTNFASSIIRSGSWVAGFYAILNNPIFGTGPGMSGYWLVDYYPDFFYLSDSAYSWYELGKSNFDAPTFSSAVTFLLEYGLILPVIAAGYLFKKGMLQAAFQSKTGRASLVSIFVVSFGIAGFQIWGYFLFLAITLAKRWEQFDVLQNRSLWLGK